jgi:micrococcal nuclease
VRQHPWSVHPDAKQNIPMGKVASEYTKSRLKGKYIELEFEGPTRGKYGRLLGYIFVDGENFNLEFVDCVWIVGRSLGI